MQILQIIKNKRDLFIISIGLVIIISIIIGLNLMKKNSNSQLNTDKIYTTNAANPADTNLPQEIATSSGLPKDDKHAGIVLLGYGGAGHDGGYLTDAIQVIYADFEKSKIALISIPRDLWVRIPNNGEAKINTVYVSGAKNNTGSALIKRILTDITGLPINYLVTVDFVGIQKVIGENLKGIEVNVSETLDDPWYPIKGEEQNLCGKTPEEVTKLTQELTGFELEKQFPCRYEHLHFEQGINKMQGGDALKYARSRHGSSDGDISRGRRTQDVLIGISKKIFTINALNDIPAFFKAVSKNIKTDLDVNIIEFFAPGLKRANNFKIIRINLSNNNVLQSSISTDKQAIFIPNDGMFVWSGIQKYIQSEIDNN